MVMVVAAVEVDGTVVAMMVAAFVAVAMPVAVAMVAVVVPVMVLMSGPVLVPLRGRRTREQHESGSDQTCDAKLHGRTLLVRDDPDCGFRLEPGLKPARSIRSAKGVTRVSRVRMSALRSC